MTNTVNNGTTTHNIDTTLMQLGKYNVNIQYTKNNTYNNAENNSNLTILDPNLKVVDCTSTNEWFKAQDNNTFTPQQCTNNIDTTGYICNIPNYFVGPVYQLERNSRMSLVLRTNNNSMMGWGLQECVNNGMRFWIFASNSNTAKLEEYHASNHESDVNLTNILSNTDVSITISVDNNGKITYTDSRGNNVTSQKSFTDEELQSLYFIFRHWNGSGRITCKELSIEYNIQQGE